jgi:hypothetical protein
MWPTRVFQLMLGSQGFGVRMGDGADEYLVEWLSRGIGCKLPQFVYAEHSKIA